MTTPTKQFSIPFAGKSLEAIWQAPDKASHALLLAHGASLSSTHPSMEALADGLASIGLASLRFDFPFRALRPEGGGRPDSPKTAQSALAAAWDSMAALAPDIPRLAGGRSYGSRMVTLAAANGTFSGGAALLLFAWSLHGPGKPATARASHLRALPLPALFCRGEEDPLADHGLMSDVLEGLPGTASLSVPGADHMFQFSAESQINQSAAMDAMFERIKTWLHNGYQTGWGESLPLTQSPAS